MNVLMLNYEYPPLGGGAAPVTRSLSEELVRQGHEVDVVTMGYRSLPEEEVLNGVHIYRMKGIRKKIEMCTFPEMLVYCLSAARFLPELMKEKDYDINHTHFIIPTGAVSRVFYKKLPYVITSHGSDVPGYNPDRFRYQHTLLRPFSKTILNRAGYIISPSTHLRRKWGTKCCSHPLWNIPRELSAGDKSE
jgi:glycosyltransferase involved in cell wall biosynthesis